MTGLQAFAGVSGCARRMSCGNLRQRAGIFAGNSGRALSAGNIFRLSGRAAPDAVEHSPRVAGDTLVVGVDHLPRRNHRAEVRPRHTVNTRAEPAADSEALELAVRQARIHDLVPEPAVSHPEGHDRAFGPGGPARMPRRHRVRSQFALGRGMARAPSPPSPRGAAGIDARALALEKVSMICHEPPEQAARARRASSCRRSSRRSRRIS